MFKILLGFLFLCSNTLFAQNIQEFSNENFSAKYSSEWQAKEQDNAIFFKPAIIIDTNDFVDYVSVIINPLGGKELGKKDFEEMINSLKKNIEYSGYKNANFKSKITSKGCTISYYEKPNQFEDAFFTSQIIQQQNEKFYIITLKCKADNEENLKIGQDILNSIQIK